MKIRNGVQSVTNEEIDKEPAGQQLDSWVAEKVMGWRVVDSDMEDTAKAIYKTFAVKDDDGLGVRRPLNNAVNGWGYDDFNPSTNITDAWEVVETLISWKKYIHIVYTEGKYYIGGATCELVPHGDWDWENDSGMADAPTAPLAISRAALKAVMK